ncbi:DUF740 family protein [Senna tora]|uniref:DUF740 family protein n=1 Tax=Senna tora TaxID=362788 RepID=A0A834WRE9_9FABA|nr:DUF740 family protein [Senna tora]
MALYLDEDEVWKCTKHPSKRRRTGICPICLRDRLLALCPQCANVRPCSCCPTTSSSSSSSSSSFSRFSFSVAATGVGVGAIGRVHNLIDSEPALRRSRSMAIPFLRSRSRFSGMDPDSTEESPALNRSKSTRSFWSMFKPQKSNKSGVQEDRDSRKVLVGEDEVGDASRRTATMMMRSRSVAVSGSGSGARERRAPAKGRGWFFPSPIKAFRQSKASKVNQERSPLYRG